MHVAYYGPTDHFKVLIEIFSSIISYEKPILKSVIGCATLRNFCAKMTEDYFLDFLWLIETYIYHNQLRNLWKKIVDIFLIFMLE